MKTKNPARHAIVNAWWPSFGRYVDAKWTGRRWLRFNELFGGWDPIENPPDKWNQKPLPPGYAECLK